MLLVLLGTGGDPGRGAAAAILIGAVVCCAAAIAGDNMQDLKSGYILGATPRNQQVMQVLGVVAAALVLPWVLDVLHTAYTLGSDELAAPQATLIQRRRGASFRLPVLAVAVGLYLPFELDSAIMLGGLVAWAATRFRDTRGLTRLGREAAAQAGDRTGLLIASGLITGEALLGIGLAIPVAVLSKPDLFPLLPREGSVWLGLAVVLAIAFALGRLALKAHDAEAVRQRV
jgi:uncharacterized oligopeptide transporter (OPT) family protein